MEGRYDLTVETVPGGIAQISCDESSPCGLNRICQPGAAPVCVEETCLGANANLVCQRGFICDENSGQCVCERSDQFQELNDSPPTAAPIGPGFQGALTLCGSETDWFSIDVAQFETVTLRLSTNDQGGLAVSILDAQLRTVSDQNIFGNDRIILDPAQNPTYIEVRSRGEPRALDYGLELLAE